MLLEKKSAIAIPFTAIRVTKRFGFSSAEQNRDEIMQYLSTFIKENGYEYVN